MKAIMLSVRPEWVAKILNSEKTVEIRKSVPKDFKGWVYIYCTKGEPTIHQRKTLSDVLDDVHFGINPTPPILNGKVVARFWFDEYTSIKLHRQSSGQTMLDYWVELDTLKKACLDYLKLMDYGKGKPLCAWHIKRLEIFDTPKVLDDFDYLKRVTKYYYGVRDTRYIPRRLTKAPQSWQYIEVKE